jgi:hypothetical protein
MQNTSAHKGNTIGRDQHFHSKAENDTLTLPTAVNAFCYNFVLRQPLSAHPYDFSLWQTGTDAGGTP